MSFNRVTPKTDNSSDSLRGISILLSSSSRITRSMPREQVSWRKPETKDEPDLNKDSLKKFSVDMRVNRREKILRKCEEKFKSSRVPFFITVLGKDGKILLNVYPNRNGRREVQLFFNKGRYDDGLQIVRSCLRNMLSFDFKKIVTINSYHGFFLAVQMNHTNESTQGYRTDKKYKNGIGLLEFVDLDEIEEFAEECSALINPKVILYLEELRKYVCICKEVAGLQLSDHR